VRIIPLFLLAGTAFQTTPAIAADELKFGKAPVWVLPQSIPTNSTSAAAAPVAILLTDQQIRFEPGKMIAYAEVAMKLQTPEGLAAGNISLPWNPATDTVTVNKLQIRRGSQIIDVLASGQTFTTIRRESNLELAVFDGVLTGNIQPEGLQQGDIIDLATTTEHVDPVLGSHVEANFGEIGGSPVQLAHIHVDWPTTVPLKVQAKGFAIPQNEKNGRKSIEVTQHDVEPAVPPKGAPLRFSISRFGEATDFASWADLATLMAPLFRKAEILPAAGPLHDEVEKIRASSTDPNLRAAKALQLVQDRVRYVALLMGQGGYVPADAETTWSRRFGDCKAKTALLLGILHSLEIEAEPIIVQSQMGDAIPERLPLLSYFNHVLVRAHIGSRAYFLDGTRTGDANLDSIEVPDFNWGLPLVPNARLTAMVPAPLRTASQERHVDVDASGGVYAPAAITLTEVYRRDAAVQANNAYSALTGPQKDEVLRREAVGFFNAMQVASSSIQFNNDKRELEVTIKGTAKLSWKDGWLYVPTSSIGFTPDFARPASAFQDAPLAVSHPRFILDVATIKLPAGFAQKQRLDTPIHETLAGVEYVRSEAINGDTLTVESSERSLFPEVPYKDALASAPRLKTISDDDVYVRLVDGYRATEADLVAQSAETPTSAQAFLDRGLLYLNSLKYDEAIADFSHAHELDIKNAWALANRAVSHAWKHDFTAARIDIAAAYAIDPANPVAARAEGIVTEQTGDFAGAIKAYTKSLIRDPLSDFAMIHRAFLYAATWKYAEALADVAQILERNPKSASALATRAMIHANKGDVAAAQRDFTAASAIDPKDEQVQHVAAALAQLNRDSNGEITALSKLLETSSNKGPVYAERAETYLKFNRYDEALADSNQALLLGARDPDLRIVRANVFMIRGDRAGVATEAESIIRENPGSAYALVAAAKAYSALGMRPKAMDAFNRALAIHPDPITYVNRAQVRPDTDFDGRIADLDAALKLEPDDVDALIEKAQQLVLKGDNASALQLYDRAGAIDPDPDNSAIPLGRALALYRSGRQQEASILLRARRERAKSARDFNSLCWAEASGDMFVQPGLADCHQAFKLDPKTRHDNIALAMLRLNRLDEAVTEFSAVIGQSHSAYGYFGRSIAYSRQGKSTEASVDRAEALKLNPDVESAFREFGFKS
jgi:tetratricopeptide (TPR) repeat protein